MNEDRAALVAVGTGVGHVVMPDVEEEHVEGLPPCRMFGVIATPEVWNQMMTAAYGRRVTIVMGEPDENGFYTPSIYEDVDTNMVLGADVLRWMRCEELLKKFVAAECYGAQISVRHHLRARAKDALGPFDMTTAWENLLTDEVDQDG